MILAIDPGPQKSAWVIYNPHRRLLHSFGIHDSCDLLGGDWCYDHLLNPNIAIQHIPIEMVACYGMPVGKDVFETALWVGRYIERSPVKAKLVYRQEVKMAICKDSRAKDSNIRQGLMNRWGGKPAIGKKANPGPLYGVSNDVWAALGVAVTFAIQNKLEPELV